ncbi:hypothetical protein BCR44DRAFT_266990 [Catenaria anguillulae PL171]|uniref:Uncharacterized protein n=1 Tax=Catenaria anguillulae PL171 TaxID=765915 RepID=A0A1Y2HBL9_9FUNG|nr:hypothetical protein BCR44DRAFT_266990 [Catenaria anguillulae PL171]
MVHHGDRFDILQKHIIALPNRVESTDRRVDSITGMLSDVRTVLAAVLDHVGCDNPTSARVPIFSWPNERDAMVGSAQTSTPKQPTRPRSSAPANAFTPIARVSAPAQSIPSPFAQSNAASIRAPSEGTIRQARKTESSSTPAAPIARLAGPSAPLLSSQLQLATQAASSSAAAASAAIMPPLHPRYAESLDDVESMLAQSNQGRVQPPPRGFSPIHRVATFASSAANPSRAISPVSSMSSTRQGQAPAPIPPPILPQMTFAPYHRPITGATSPPSGPPPSPRSLRYAAHIKPANVKVASDKIFPGWTDLYDVEPCLVDGKLAEALEQPGFLTETQWDTVYSLTSADRVSDRMRHMFQVPTAGDLNTVERAFRFGATGFWFAAVLEARRRNRCYPELQCWIPMRGSVPLVLPPGCESTLMKRSRCGRQRSTQPSRKSGPRRLPNAVARPQLLKYSRPTSSLPGFGRSRCMTRSGCWPYIINDCNHCSRWRAPYLFPHVDSLSRVATACESPAAIQLPL